VPVYGFKARVVADATDATAKSNQE